MLQSLNLLIRHERRCFSLGHRMLTFLLIVVLCSPELSIPLRAESPGVNLGQMASPLGSEEGGGGVLRPAPRTSPIDRTYLSAMRVVPIGLLQPPTASEPPSPKDKAPGTAGKAKKRRAAILAAVGVAAMAGGIGLVVANRSQPIQGLQERYCYNGDCGDWKQSYDHPRAQTAGGLLFAAGLVITIPSLVTLGRK